MHAMEYVSFILVGLYFSVWVAWDWASSKYIIRLWCFCVIQRCKGAWLASWSIERQEWQRSGCIGTNQFWLLFMTFNFVLHFVSLQPAQSVNFYGRWNWFDSHATLQRLQYSLWVLNCEPNMKLQGMRVMFYNSKRIDKRGERGGNKEASKWGEFWNNKLLLLVCSIIYFRNSLHEVIMSFAFKYVCLWGVTVSLGENMCGDLVQYGQWCPWWIGKRSLFWRGFWQPYLPQNIRAETKHHRLFTKYSRIYFRNIPSVCQGAKAKWQPCWEVTWTEHGGWEWFFVLMFEFCNKYVGGVAPVLKCPCPGCTWVTRDWFQDIFIIGSFLFPAY